MSELSNAVAELEAATARLASSFQGGLDNPKLAQFKSKLALCQMWAVVPTKPADLVMDRGERLATRLEAAELLRAHVPIRASIVRLGLPPEQLQPYLDRFDAYCESIRNVRDNKSRTQTWGVKTSLVTITVQTATIVVEAADVTMRQVRAAEAPPRQQPDRGIGA